MSTAASNTRKSAARGAWIVALFAALVASGCVQLPPAPPPPPVYPPSAQLPPAATAPGERADDPRPAPEAPPEAPPESPESPPLPRTAAQASGRAVVALLDRGEQLAAQGDYVHAAAAVERALDVEPRNPFVYHRLAELRLKQGQLDQAQALARKSNSLAGRNNYLRANNWQLIARILGAAGDPVGAAAAEAHAEYYANLD